MINDKSNLGLTSSVKYIKGVGEQRAKLFKKLEVLTAGDLLRFYPRTYNDWTHIVSIAHAPSEEPCCVCATVDVTATTHKVRSDMALYKTRARDDTGSIYITIFNSEYSAMRLKENEEFIFYGVMSGTGRTRQLNSPLFEPAETGRKIHSVYPLTAGLSNKIITKVVESALVLANEKLPDPIPTEIRERYGLCPLHKAIRSIHRPQSMEDLEAARYRLIFEEFYTLQVNLLRLKDRNRQPTELKLSCTDPSGFYSLLPFEPTMAQRRVVLEALEDMGSHVPMSRVVQGDVGSGKTAVAAALCWCSAQSGMQSALMAPTEILAEQHFKTLSGFFKDTQIRVELLTGSVTTANKRRIRERLAVGEVQILVGTHALISEGVEFQRLGLVITDEQHRFGVKQREALAAKGRNPHMLVMSATPIPRTLALTIYGDLDISILDELPPGRKAIETYAIDSLKRERAFNYVKKHLDSGLQAYVVCPLVEEGEQDLAAAVSYFERLQRWQLAGYRLGLLHGRMKASEKEQVMSDFACGKLQALVATTVIEVGVDVPNAVIMVIENAERFGLSQLHQLRGRVGRGSVRSTCILISDAQNKTALERMKILCSTNDGFKISEEDLRLRGPGDFFGKRQHGLPELKLASMAEDVEILQKAQEAVKQEARGK
jgi:ATP-dependent DNA helicase RecG